MAVRLKVVSLGRIAFADPFFLASGGRRRTPSPLIVTEAIKAHFKSVPAR